MLSHQAEHYQVFGSGDISRYRNFGIGINALRPISRFQRFELGLQYNYIEHANFRLLICLFHFFQLPARYLK